MYMNKHKECNEILVHRCAILYYTILASECRHVLLQEPAFVIEQWGLQRCAGYRTTVQ